MDYINAGIGLVGHGIAEAVFIPWPPTNATWWVWAGGTGQRGGGGPGPQAQKVSRVNKKFQFLR